MAVAVVVAAGRGERLGHSRPKALVPLAGRPMLAWSVDALRATPAVSEIVVVLPAAELHAAPAGVTPVPGGAVRSDSVRRGVVAAADDPVIVVHDAARPLATPTLFTRAVAELESGDADAVIVAVPVPDTLKAARSDGVVTRTIERAGLWAVQTPQVFRRAALEPALEREDLRARATDDAWLIEQAGGTVRVIDAGEPNFKITTPADLALAELVLGSR